MFSNRVFQLAFFISLVAHGILLLQNAHLNLLDSREREKTTEVRYMEPAKAKEPEVKTRLAVRQHFLALPPRIGAPETKIAPPDVDRNKLIKGNKAAISPQQTLLDKPSFIKPDVISIKKKISLSSPDLDKPISPAYLAYSALLREKITQALYQNYSGTETGEVNVSFVVSLDGKLKAVHIRDEKSSSGQFLKDITIKSVRDAASFPPFAKDLDYPELTFNVIVSFQIE